jgi:hypothetical protein
LAKIRRRKKTHIQKFKKTKIKVKVKEQLYEYGNRPSMLAEIKHNGGSRKIR